MGRRRADAPLRAAAAGRFALSATDANRWALRLARLVTGRPKVAGLRVLLPRQRRRDLRRARPRRPTISRAPGNVGPAGAVDRPPGRSSGTTSTSVETSSPTATSPSSSPNRRSPTSASCCPSRASWTGSASWPPLRHAAADRRDPHLLGRLRAAAPRPGACEPDIVVIGKSIAGGIPIGRLRHHAEVAAAIAGRVDAGDADLVDVGGVGGTLAGNALSIAAARDPRRGAHRRRPSTR